MAYVTGSAADMAAVKTALVNACTANGWTEQTDAGGKTVLSNGGCYVRVEATTGTLELLGRTSLDSGDAPGVVSMRPIDGNAISFPVTYFAFIFSTEVFFVINYSDIYQWCAFGQSQQNGLSGTGNLVAASAGSADPYEGVSIGDDTGGAGGGYNRTSAALFWTTYMGREPARNNWVHNDFEASYPWALGNGSNTANSIGIRYLTELIRAQPSQFSGEAVLLPIKSYKQRLDNKVSQILELSYARHIRIDNHTPEQVITLGSDEWMIFPYYRKNITNRDGGSAADHSGTFGWAIKKA